MRGNAHSPVPARLNPAGRLNGMTEKLSAPLPVAVLGANGRMGAEAVKAIEAAREPGSVRYLA